MYSDLGRKLINDALTAPAGHMPPVGSDEMPKAHQAIGWSLVQIPSKKALSPDATTPSFMLQSAETHTRGIIGGADGLAVCDCPGDAVLLGVCEGVGDGDGDAGGGGDGVAETFDVN